MPWLSWLPRNGPKEIHHFHQLSPWHVRGLHLLNLPLLRLSSGQASPMCRYQVQKVLGEGGKKKVYLTPGKRQ